MGRKEYESLSEATILKPFFIGITKVTQDQYVAIANTNPSHNRFDGGSHPVEKIRYNDLTGADGFLVKLNRHFSNNGKAGWKTILPNKWEAVLPTEAEWEIACRAGTTTALHNGFDLSNTFEDSNLDPIAVYGSRTTDTVAKLKPNKWGLYDTLGNVWEWTDKGTLRGGSYRENAASSRAASQIPGQIKSRKRDSRFGFRLVLREKKK